MVQTRFTLSARKKSCNFRYKTGIKVDFYSLNRGKGVSA